MILFNNTHASWYKGVLTNYNINSDTALHSLATAKMYMLASPLLQVAQDKTHCQWCADAIDVFFMVFYYYFLFFFNHKKYISELACTIRQIWYRSTVSGQTHNDTSIPPCTMELENGVLVPNSQFRQENWARFQISIISALKQSAVFIQSPHEETSRQMTVVPMAIMRKRAHPATVFSNKLGNK